MNRYLRIIGSIVCLPMYIAVGAMITIAYVINNSIDVYGKVFKLWFETFYLGE